MKIEAELESNGQMVIAELPRTEYARLKLERGQRVLVLPRDATGVPGGLSNLKAARWREAAAFIAARVCLPS